MSTEKEILIKAQAEGRASTLKAYLKLSGPGWLQSAITLGGGSLAGALFLGVIKNALPIIEISPFWQMGISGAVIVAAVVINSRSEKRKGRLILREVASAGGPS